MEIILIFMAIAAIITQTAVLLLVVKTVEKGVTIKINSEQIHKQEQPTSTTPPALSPAEEKKLLDNIRAANPPMEDVVKALNEFMTGGTN